MASARGSRRRTSERRGTVWKTAPCPRPLWVKLGNTLIEYTTSLYPLEADIGAPSLQDVALLGYAESSRRLACPAVERSSDDGWKNRPDRL